MEWKRGRPHLPAAVRVLLGLTAALVLTAAGASPGSLDTTFANGGKLTDLFGGTSDRARAILVRSDGRLILAGQDLGGGNYNFEVAGYSIDGAPDPALTGHSYDLFGDNDYVNSIALQSDNKIVLAGTSYIPNSDQDVALIRTQPNGDLDTSFGNGGIVRTPVGAVHDSAQAVAVVAGGKILVGGWATWPNFSRFILLRYTSNGQLDPTFGTNGDGKVVTDFGGNSAAASAMAVLSDGKILLGGGASGPGSEDFAVAKYSSEGVLDTSFGTGGKALIDFGSNQDFANALALQPDGKILLAGFSGANTASQDFALARLSSNGVPDPSFGVNGRVTTPIGPGEDHATGIGLGPAGTIYVGGYASNGSNHDFAVACYNSQGSLLPGFGAGTGKITTSFGSDEDVAECLAVQNGQPILAGWSNISGHTWFAAARYNAPDVTSPTVTQGTVVTESPTRVYLPFTLSDSGSGVAQVKLTSNSDNCYLEWTGPGGVVNTPSGAPLVISPPVMNTTVRVVKINAGARARVELQVWDAAGNSTLTDPVIATLQLKQGKQLTRTFQDIPLAEHYVTLQNGAPGFTEARLWVNGRLVSQGALTAGQVVNLDIAAWLRPGNQNRVRITASGPKGATAVFVVADQAAAPLSAAVLSRATTNLEFTR